MAKMQERERLLLVAPYEDEPAMLQALSQGLDVEVQTELFRTQREVAAGVWRRHGHIWRSAWVAFRQRHRVGYIVFGEQFIGLYYACLMRLLGWGQPGPRTAVLQLIYNRRPGWKGALYHAIYRWLVSSPSLDVLVCAASFERALYAKEFGPEVDRKLVFIPFGRNKPLAAGEGRDAERAAEGGFFFTGGTSNRDYPTLVEAFRGLPYRLEIACYPGDVAGLDLPPNVSVLHGVFDDEFKQKVRDCLAVVIPIRKADVSAGQLVLLDAMRLGKSSIVTQGSCMEDYVDDSCALRVPGQDAAALRAAIERLAGDADLRRQLGETAAERYARQFTRQAFGRHIAAALKGRVDPLERAIHQEGNP